jgi:transposase
MITIGVDAHKRIHVALALDEAGREIGEWRGPNSQAGWRDLSLWAFGLGGERQWGIEGAWGYGRCLAQHLVERGEAVYEINPRWTAAGRQRARKPGKTDRLDARAVALFVRQEAPVLPVVQLEDDSVILELLSTERDQVLAEIVRIRNQIHALLTHIDPEYQSRLPALKSRSGLAVLQAYDAPGHHPVQLERVAGVRRLARRLALAVAQLDELTERIRAGAQTRFSPLTRLCGVNLLTAGMLAGALGPGRRFANDAQLAAYAGVAPLEASSAGLVRHRLNRGGNRRLNAIVHRIALTQAHHSPEARAYLERRASEGKSRREAIRALKRFIVRAIWRLWLECEPTSAALSMATAA